MMATTYKTVNLDTETWEWLRRQADQKGVTIVSLIRSRVLGAWEMHNGEWVQITEVTERPGVRGYVRKMGA